MSKSMERNEWNKKWSLKMANKKGDSWIEYSNYEKHYIEDTKRGHKITLLSKDGSKLEINCVWPDRERDHLGRVSIIKND